MAQTPKSISVNITGGSVATANNIYTVPAGKTAVVKSLFAQQADAGSGNSSVSKLVSGQSFPIAYQTANNITPATGGTEQKANLLVAPLTLGAGETLQVSTGASGVYVIPSVSTAPTTAADGSTVVVSQILYANSIYMMVGYSTTGAYVATSTDCVTWTQRTAAASLSARYTAVAFTNGIWIASYLTVSSAVYYSTDNGVTWTTATGMAGITPNQIYGANSQFVVVSPSNRLYYSTNGNAWTESTSYYTASGAASIFTGGWSGSHWVFGSGNGSIASTDFITWKGFNSISNTRLSLGNFSSIDYSTAYSRYYATFRSTGLPNLWRSSEGLLWDNLATFTSFAPYKICCAGSNTVLIGVPATSLADRALSTNGTTFTLSSDVRSYTGPVFGLANGYFLSYQDTTQDAAYVSTNPTSSTGTNVAAVSGFIATAAAADPISGKWCCVGIDSNDFSWRAQGGATANSINTSVVIGPPKDSTIGQPVSLTWSPADGYFYIMSDTGQVWRSATYNGTWTTQSTGNGVSGYNAGYSAVIRAVGTTLYAVQGNNEATIYVGSTLNGGAGWTTVSLSSNFPAYRFVTRQARAGIYLEGNGATNGSYFLMMNNYGTVSIFDPSGTRANPVSPPMGVSGLQSGVNGYTFMYAGVSPSGGSLQGAYWSTNPITTYGNYFSTSSTQLGVIGTVSNKVTYAGGSYYLNSLDNTGNVYSSTNLSTWSFKPVGASMCGVPTFNGGGGYANDGTNYVAWRSNGTPNEVTRTTSPQNFIYASTITASLVEID